MFRPMTHDGSQNRFYSNDDGVKVVQDSEHHVEVLNEFSALTLAISTLCDALIEESHLMAYTHDNSENTQRASLISRDKTCQILRALEYQNNQAPREILLCPGFIGASLPTLKLAMHVNECKDKFKKTVLALKAEKLISQSPALTEKMHSIISRNLATAKTLSTTGLSRLHLKQCYRKIPILEHAPHKISWTWAHTRSIRKITIQKAQELLLKKGNDVGIEIQLQKLGTLAPNESLAIVQELAPHLRANIVFKKNQCIERTMIKGHIPIFFPCSKDTQYPEFKAPTDKCEKSKERAKRSDEKLDPIVFLPAIRAHRYCVT